MSNKNLSMTIRKVLLKAFRNGFASRSDGEFRPHFQIIYSDTMSMITIGGCLTPKGSASKFEQRVRSDLPFLLKKQPYTIKNFALTERERALFDLAVTNPRSNSRHANQLRVLGFNQKEFDAYRELIRFLPRYYESLL